MRRSNIAALVALAALAFFAAFTPADALQSLRATKYEVITVVVTPSPPPVGYLPQSAPPAGVSANAAVAALFTDPSAGPRQIASAGAVAWDVPPGGGVQVAQSSVQPTPVPVQFVALPDPNAKYLQLIQHTPELDVPYGTTKFTCAFEVYTFYDKATYALNDYGQGTASTGTGTYPIMNYPTTSYLSWATPDFSPTYHTYWNSGAPGEKVWSGAMNQAQQHCVDLTIVVPNSLAAGTYTAVIQYNLLVN